MIGPWSAVVVTPLPEGWRFGIRCRGGMVCETAFLPVDTPLQVPQDDCSRGAVTAVQAYFASPRIALALPLAAGGTPFQQRVWQALQAIPPGRPCSYGALAAQLGSSARAVAAACRANPIPLLIPCHRVVAAQGPGGYMGATAGAPLRLKQWLLDHEAAG
ncbi:methylated-DNA--[protein]-cysteine S-methyltransferase [Sulfurivermis fontis]|uniref:methylated-DNA--[protein]-cysteine S-methyltransferase n=1 Tax=Sulfurivermis fontis TaxID=1972068 RepID=UPI001E400633|nr:methylated-DNA--[protein]-cysteine S-methyltransferase [Sulfurivermis fontis]